MDPRRAATAWADLDIGKIHKRGAERLSAAFSGSAEASAPPSRRGWWARLRAYLSPKAERVPQPTLTTEASDWLSATKATHHTIGCPSPASVSEAPYQTFYRGGAK